MKIKKIHVISYLKNLLFFIILFPGSFKLVINVDSSLVNAVAILGLLFIFIVTTNNKLYLTNESKNYLYYIAYIFLITNFYFVFSIEQVDSLSFQYLMRAYYFIFGSVFVLIMFNGIDDFKKLISIILTISFILTLYNLFGLLNYNDSFNYLTYAFTIGISIVLLSYRLIFNCDGFFFKSALFIGISYFILLNLFSGSRGSLLFSILLVLVMFVKYRNKVDFKRFTATIIAISASIFFILYYFVTNYNINTWFAFKILRLWEGNIEEEPRYKLYSDAYNYMIDNFSIFGFGFHGSYNIGSIFLESFPYELLFNYGLFGLVVLILLFFYSIQIYNLNINYYYTLMSFMMFLYIFLNFSKGWSLYSGYVIFVALAIVIKIFINERENIK